MSVNSFIKKILPNYLTYLIRWYRGLYILNNIKSNII